MSWENFLQKARRLSKREGTGSLLLRVQEEVTVLPLANCAEVFAVDLGAEDLATAFCPETFPRLFASEDVLLAAARTMTTHGVSRRNEGHLQAAFYCYRFALVVAIDFGQLQGVRANCGNLWQLRDTIRDAFRHRGGEEAGGRTGSLQREGLAQLLKRMRADCAVFAPRVMHLAKALDAGGDVSAGLVATHAAKRLVDISGEAGLRRHLLREIQHRALQLGERGPLREAILEELALSDAEEVTLAAFDSNSHAARDFGEIWETYQQERLEVPAHQASPSEERACRAALKSFEQLRAEGVSAGGAFGHRVSYGISAFLQPIGRDLTRILLEKGDSPGACEAAERVRCRALCDWMGRTHPSNRFRMRTNIQGSLGETCPASLSEIAMVAMNQRTPLLMYFSTTRGYVAWLQKTDGELVFSAIDNPDESLATLRTLLPALEARDRAGRSGTLRRDFVIEGQAPSAERLSSCLRSLRRLLLPTTLQRALRDEPPCLIIVPDGALDYVPFCALENEDGSFLIEECEILYWPSVTLGLILADQSVSGGEAAEGFPAPRQSVGRGRGSLVLGDPDYATGFDTREGDRKVEMHFTALPGTRREADAVAALLDVRPMLGKAAVAASFIDLKLSTHRSLLSVLHVAAHGLLDVAHPENSALALSEGLLTVRMLLEYDPGIRARLVMLSACQTCAGHQHPDSLISLANAFHIAGARSVGATLWKIADDATVPLITRFYEALLHGENLAQALRTGQVALLRENRNPYFWAAFKISGSVKNPLASPVA